MRKKNAAIAAFALVTIAAPALVLAQAQDKGFYIGGSLGQAKLKDWCSSEGAPAGAALTACDDKDTAWKIFAGYQFHRNFAAEIHYIDMGSVSASATVSGIPVSVKADNTAYGAALVGLLPLGSSQFSLFGKLGFQHLEQKSSGSVAGFTINDSGTENEVLYGLGAKWNLN